MCILCTCVYCVHVYTVYMCILCTCVYCVHVYTVYMCIHCVCVCVPSYFYVTYETTYHSMNHMHTHTHTRTKYGFSVSSLKDKGCQVGFTLSWDGCSPGVALGVQVTHKP